jgi:hypothetical protein
MQSVLFTQTFMKQASDCGLEDDELQEIAVVIARDPLAGNLIRGAGGARKLRHALRGKGKSGGLRTIHFFGGVDTPVFMLAVYSKNQKADISAEDRNALAKLLPQIVKNYRRRLK